MQPSSSGLIMLALACAGAPALARRGPATPASPEDFRQRAPIAGPLAPGGVTRLHLTPEILQAARGLEADLRLFDDQGREVPFAILSEQRPAVAAASFDFAIRSYRPLGPTEELILERPEGGAAFDAVRFAIAQGDFKKAVRVEACDELAGLDPAAIAAAPWRPLAADVIFDYRSRVALRRTELRLPLTDLRWLRVTLAPPDEPHGSDQRLLYRFDDHELFRGERCGAAPIRIDRISGATPASGAPEPAIDRLLLDDPTVRVEARGTTLVELGPVNVPASELELRVHNPYFLRPVEVWAGDSETDRHPRRVGAATIYSLPGMRAPQTTVTLDGLPGPHLSLTVQDGDNPRLKLSGVELRWVRRQLFFIPEAGRGYWLHWGGGQVDRRPSYELAGLLGLSGADPWQAPAATIGASEANPGFRVRPPPAGPWHGGYDRPILIGLVFIAVGVMTLWVTRLLQQMRRGGA